MPSSEGPPPAAFGDLVGQERAVGVLRRALLRDQVAHAYLLHGPPQVGKSTAAHIFARALNCEAAAQEKPCGACRSCQLAARGSHPDVRVLGGAGKSAVSIQIQDLRDQFVYDVQLKPVLGRRKVYLLDHVERTAHLAIHTVLRTLEEPPPYVVIILVTDSLEALPPTIPSRCQRVAFSLVGTDAIAAALAGRGLDQNQAAALARLSGGRIAWALQAAARPEVLAARRALLDLCAGLEDRGLAAALRVAEEIQLQAAELARPAKRGEPAEDEEEEDGEGSPAVTSRALRAELPWCLDVVVGWYRDLIAAGQGGPLLNPDCAEALAARVRPGSTQGAERAIACVLEAKRAIEGNANIDIALEAMAVGLLGSCG